MNKTATFDDVKKELKKQVRTLADKELRFRLTPLLEEILTVDAKDRKSVANIQERIRMYQYDPTLVIGLAIAEIRCLRTRLRNAEEYFRNEELQRHTQQELPL
jgi:hypothetical protein